MVIISIFVYSTSLFFCKISLFHSCCSFTLSNNILIIFVLWRRSHKWILLIEEMCLSVTALIFFSSTKLISLVIFAFFIWIIKQICHFAGFTGGRWESDSCPGQHQAHSWRGHSETTDCCGNRDPDQCGQRGVPTRYVMKADSKTELTVVKVFLPSTGSIPRNSSIRSS